MTTNQQQAQNEVIYICWDEQSADFAGWKMGGLGELDPVFTPKTIVRRARWGAKTPQAMAKARAYLETEEARTFENVRIEVLPD